jgi:hypothetical protein
MLRLKTDDEKQLREFAKGLPMFHYNATEQVEISGEDLLLGGYSKKDGIEKGKSYFISVPVYYEINHYRRLKRTYQRNGIEGIRAYVAVIKNSLSEYID